MHCLYMTPEYGLVQIVLSDLPRDLPIALVGTCDCPSADLDEEAASLFGASDAAASAASASDAEPDGVLSIPLPGLQQRRAMFSGVADAIALPPEPEKPPEAAVPLPQVCLRPAVALQMCTQCPHANALCEQIFGACVVHATNTQLQGAWQSLCSAVYIQAEEHALMLEYPYVQTATMCWC